MPMLDQREYFFRISSTPGSWPLILIEDPAPFVLPQPAEVGLRIHFDEHPVSFDRFLHILGIDRVNGLNVLGFLRPCRKSPPVGFISSKPTHVLSPRAWA